MKNVTLQYDLRPALPNVYGTLDYRTFRDILVKMDEILTKSGLEQDICSEALARQITEEQTDPKLFYSTDRASLRYKKIRYALRCNIARHLTGESYRNFSIRLADSTLFQGFTDIQALSACKAISKSALERYEKYFEEGFIADRIRKWLSGFSEEKKAIDVGLKHSVDFKKTRMDSTCIKANIHFPVDWLLLRDAARSLLSAIKTIRAQGLKHRMIDPALLLKNMNKLCISMTHTRRKKDSKQQRKAVLRSMKKLSKVLSKHAARYPIVARILGENGLDAGSSTMCSPAY